MDIIWEISVPVRSQFATLMPSWEHVTTVKCRVCGRSISEDVDRLTAWWEEGRHCVGDFTFAIGHLIATRMVCDELRERFRGFRACPVDVRGALIRDTTPTDSLPSEAMPDLCWLKVTAEAPLLPQSTVVVDYSCPACDFVQYRQFIGIETKNSRRHVARTPGKGFFFSRDALGDSDIFRPRFTGFELCTQRVKDYVEKRGFSNIEFLNVGELV